MAKIIGVVPARMAASRFPGKPLYPIKGIPLVQHCFLRASLYNRWTQLVLATCDREIEQFANDKGMPVTMTSDSHIRALDRVAEAAQLIDPHLNATDIVVCVQGDEPLLGPDMLEVVVNPILNDQGIEGTMLATPILNRETFLNRDIVKIVHDKNGDGEADFIEAFWNDDDVSSVFHAYNFNLQTDENGNFYLAKAGQHTDHHRPGSIMKIPPEGGKADVVAWGVRTPNGMGRL